MDQLQFHNMSLSWLNGGVTCLDGGAMFGVVPKPLWSRKYPVNEKTKLNYQQNRSSFNMRAKLPH